MTAGRMVRKVFAPISFNGFHPFAHLYLIVLEMDGKIEDIVLNLKRARRPHNRKRLAAHE
jgi:hypothetical protein